MATLLRGGEYILFCNHRTLECWSVRCSKLFWVYPKNGPKSTIQEYDADVIDGGAGVNIIVSERNRELGSSRLQIVKLDFGSGISTPLFLSEAPRQCRFSEPKICGDIAVVYFLESTRQSSSPNPRLINWKTKDHLELTSPTFQLTVIPILNYILVLSNILPGGPKVSILDNSAFSSHWRNVAMHPTPNKVPISELEFLLQESITFHDLPSLTLWGTIELFAYESPLQDETYRVWALMRDGQQNHLATKNSGGFNDRQPSCALKYILLGTQDIRFLEQILYFGAFGHDRGESSDGGIVSDLSYIHISTYSGALTCIDTTGNRVLISYYK
ncbi:hypothetical protein MSAN_01568100 [Mycena sanguinolenta]|uniref:Uncharacterized protein n=1 Tax=Mycena sanguinolenta TaxID=230812 RepID=A0A8H6Y3N3_9AGAR|nr:hypothetical protein MSAN_01568100 [Mycena sanguinolenta]